jgi:hypothetical protein
MLQEKEALFFNESLRITCNTYVCFETGAHVINSILALEQVSENVIAACPQNAEGNQVYAHWYNMLYR